MTDSDIYKNLYTSITKKQFFFTGNLDAETTMSEKGKFVFEPKCFQINLRNINGVQSYNSGANKTSITK